MAARSPVVSVVIPALNERRVILNCLDGLMAQQAAPSFEVIVVDNGSADGTFELAAAHPIAPRTLIERAKGPYAARNAGIGVAHGSIIAFTDADCVAHPGWLSEGVGAITAGADLVGGALKPRRSDRPSIWERYDSVVLVQDIFIRVEHFAATGNLFVRSDMLKSIGCFDPLLDASGDVEFGIRAWRAGFRLAYCERAIVYHAPAKTLRETWGVHRRLGAGFSQLSRRGLRSVPWRDQALLIRLGTVVDRVAADGPRIRRRRLGPVHWFAMTGRWTGRLTRRAGRRV